MHDQLIKAAGPAQPVWSNHVNKIPLLYDNKIFTFQGCTMSARFKFNDFRQLCFRAEIVEQEFIDFLTILHDKCTIFSREEYFKPVNRLLFDNYFFGKCCNNCVIEDIHGNQVDISFEREITFIPTFKFCGIYCSVNGTYSSVKFIATKIIVL